MPFNAFTAYLIRMDDKLGGNLVHPDLALMQNTYRRSDNKVWKNYRDLQKRIEPETAQDQYPRVSDVGFQHTATQKRGQGLQLGWQLLCTSKLGCHNQRTGEPLIRNRPSRASQDYSYSLGRISDLGNIIR